MKKEVLAFITLITVLLFAPDAFAQTLEDRIKILEESLKKQEQTIHEQGVLTTRS